VDLVSILLDMREVTSLTVPFILLIFAGVWLVNMRNTGHSPGSR
jgi:hypothetical protein